MKKSLKSLSTLLMAGTVFMFSACDKDDNIDDPNPNEKNTTVKGVLESESNFSMMNEAVELSGHSHMFTETNSNTTLFTPNNTAFQEMFADMGVSTMAELKAQMGAEVFAEMIVYHAVEGKNQVSDFTSGFINSMAEAEGNSRLSIYVENESDARLVLNGDDEYGAATVSSTSIGATNGALIEINSILMPQNNYENLKETHTSESMMMKVISEADASVRASLEDDNTQSTLFVMTDNQVETLLSMNLGSILDDDDLENLLDATQKSDLFTHFSVSSISDLRTKIKLSDLAAHGVTTADVYAEMDKADKTELAHSFIMNGNYHVNSLQGAGSVITKLGSNLTVSNDAAGNIVLTNSTGAKITLNNKPASSRNGSIYMTEELSE